jgi:DNA-binding MurR/RpiR family transcriptional regulator
MSDIVGNVKSFARGRIEGRVHAVGSRFLGLAEALRSTVRQEQSTETALADGAGESLADRLERTGRYLSDLSLESAVSDLESAARRAPLTFGAASFLLAFATTRFLKASRSA